MNKVYLDENGKVFINEHEIDDVISISTKTDFTGTHTVLELLADFKSNFENKEKAHTLGECANE